MFILKGSIAFIGSFIWCAICLALFIGAVASFITCLLEGEAEEETKRNHLFLKIVVVVFIVLVFVKGFSTALGVAIVILDIYGMSLYIKNKRKDKKIEAERKKKDEEKAGAENYCLEAEKFENGTDEIEKDLGKARELYQKAAELGNKKAQHKYGVFCLKGIGGEKAPQSAFENLKKANEYVSGDSLDFDLEGDNSYALGLCYSNGTGTEVDLREALACFQYAEKMGEFNGAFRVAGIYKKWGETESAEKWYIKAAKMGHRSAIYELGKLLMKKTGDISSLQKAEEIFEAVKLSYAEKKTECDELIQKTKALILEEQKKEADVYFENIEKNKKVLEPAQAIQEYDDNIRSITRDLSLEDGIEGIENAASNGYAPAEFLLGYLTARGVVNNNNPVIAVEWIWRAVKQNYITDSLVDYDWLKAQDEALADRVLEFGKEHGSAFALYQQGYAAMQMGNEESAVEFLEKASAAGNAAACYDLAVWNLKKNQEQQSEESIKKALNLLKESAEQEYSKACHAIGCLVKKDHPDMAEYYFEVAAWNGCIPAMAELALLYNTADKLSEQLFWLDKMTIAGEYRLLPKLPELHMAYVVQLYTQITNNTREELSEADYKQLLKVCEDAVHETGKAYFWQKCLLLQDENAYNQSTDIIRMRKSLYETQSTLENLMRYAIKAERIKKEIEETERREEIRRIKEEKEEKNMRSWRMQHLWELSSVRKWKPICWHETSRKKLKMILDYI